MLWLEPSRGPCPSGLVSSGLMLMMVMLMLMSPLSDFSSQWAAAGGAGMQRTAQQCNTVYHATQFTKQYNLQCNTIYKFTKQYTACYIALYCTCSRTAMQRSCCTMHYELDGDCCIVLYCRTPYGDCCTSDALRAGR